MKKIDDWTCTDPDNLQYGRKISEGVYEFKEFSRGSYGDVFISHTKLGKPSIEELWRDSDFWEELTIKLKDYSDEQIDNHISAYYGSIEEIKETYGKDSDWIIAECIFEQESQLY